MGNLENMTLRLDEKLRQAAEKSAEANGRTLAVEIRSALTSYYKLGTGTVTFKALEERLRKHEELYHGKEPLSPDQCRVAVQESGVPAQVEKTEEVEEPKIEPEPGKADLFTGKIADTAKILTNLIRMLEAGLNPTPADLEEATGIPSRQIGRLLNARGIVAKNTRIAKRSARYFLPAMLPQVKEVYEGLNQ